MKTTSLRTIMATLAGIILGALVLTNATVAHSQAVPLHIFTGGSDGGQPYAGLVEGTDGNFYGITSLGGSGSNGTVFRVTPNGSLTTLYSFTNGGGVGFPEISLVQGTDGSLYGARYAGGDFGYGTVFKITTTGSLTTLHSFTGGADGGYPSGSLVLGADGNFYGTTSDYGAYGAGSGGGTFFKITPAGFLTTLYSFTRGSSDEGIPEAGLVQGKDGNFYGTTNDIALDFGTIFQITPSGSLTTLYRFTGGSDGGYPSSSLIQAADGSFYGATQSGIDRVTAGTVFKVTTTGSFTTLCTLPYADYVSLIQGADGNFYGTTSGGDGSIFEITTSGSLTLLYSTSNFIVSPTSLVQATDGNFYGTGDYNPAGESGSVFKFVVTSTTTAVATKGDSAAGIKNAVFSVFGNPAINSQGHAAFQATVAGATVAGSRTTPVAATANSGIWADSGSNGRMLVVQTGSSAPGTSGAVFSTLSDPVYNNNDAVAFRATLRSGDTITTGAGNNSFGIWANNRSSVQLVARAAGAAPGTGGGVFQSFAQFALPDQGGVVMLANLLAGTSAAPAPGGITSANNQGIWAVDNGENLQLIVQKGTVHPITGKIITGLTFLPVASYVSGQSRSFDQGTGDLMYKATFKDGSFGIYKVTFQ